MNTIQRRKRSKKLAVTITLSVLACIIIAYIVVKCFAITPGIKSKNGIAALETINLNGADQSLLIRSEDTANPILLYLHSGPGSTEMVPFRTWHQGLEKYFTVVMWEQRGTGKSYDASIPPESMTIDQMVDDTKTLCEYLLKRFHQKKLFLAGHSWGSALGLMTACMYPEYFYAYIGSGQMVAQQDAEKISYDYLLKTASETNNKKAYDELTQINSRYPYLDTEHNPAWYEDIKTQRKWLTLLGGEVYGKTDNSFLFIPALGISEYTISDFIKFAKGSETSLKALWPEVMKLDFRKSYKDIPVPVFFLQGRHDSLTPSVLVEEYFNTISAPHKELIWFESSAHHPMYEEADKYEEILINKVLPLAGPTSKQ